MAEQTIWGIHAKGSKLESILLKQSQLAVGWGPIGDASAFGHDRELLKAKFAQANPNEKPGAIPVIAGQLFRFINELQTGDHVVFRSPSEREVYIGEVTGSYVFDPSDDSEHPQRRPVRWLKHVPVTAVSQGALYELGSILTFFQIKNYADEWAQLLSAAAPQAPIEPAESVRFLFEATEQNTRDFILKQLSKELKGHPFAHFVANLLQAMDYRTEVSPEGTDGGIDITAHRDELGFEPPIIKVQVKSTSGSIGGPDVAQLIGNLGANEHGLFVTLGTYSVQAKQKRKPNIRLIDGEELVDLVLSHYHELDPRYKSVIPLKQMFVPQPLAEE
jgi:restriction system protein